MAKQKISLKIAGKGYPLLIDRDKEEVYRLAEREVNGYVTNLEKGGYKGFQTQDYLALTALNFAIAKLQLAQSREIGDENIDSLMAVERRLDDYLNKLK